MAIRIAFLSFAHMHAYGYARQLLARPKGEVELAGVWDREAARGKIEAIRARLLKNPERFAEQALKHSECPTAMNGGLLGSVPRGQLYAELEAVAFALPAATLSEPVESELGWHLIYCEAIHAERQSQLEEVRQTIRDHLEQQRRSMCQKSWINSLRRQMVAAG
jgi:nitrogen fixation protein NifM